MFFDVVEAEYIADYKIKLSFENGKRGIVDLKDYSKKGGVFEDFKDKNYFMKFYVNKDLGTICWPNGADIAPETLLGKIK